MTARPSVLMMVVVVVDVDQITGLIMAVVAITRVLTPTLSTLQVIQGASNVQALALFDPLPSLALSATGPI